MENLLVVALMVNRLVDPIRTILSMEVVLVENLSGVALVVNRLVKLDLHHFARLAIVVMNEKATTNITYVI